MIQHVMIIIRRLIDGIRRGQRHTPRPSNVFVYIHHSHRLLILLIFIHLLGITSTSSAPSLIRGANPMLWNSQQFADTHPPSPLLFSCFGIWIGLESRIMGSSPASRILGNGTSMPMCYLHVSSDQWVTRPTPL